MRCMVSKGFTITLVCIGLVDALRGDFFVARGDRALGASAVFATTVNEQSQSKKPLSNAKSKFLDSLDTLTGNNVATSERTQLVRDLTLQNPTPRPGSRESFQPLAAGTWTVIYAPHIYTMSKIGGGSFDPVLYILREDGTMESHARFDFPSLPMTFAEKRKSLSGWFSVSGTYSTQDDDRVCRVDFDKTWMKWNGDNDDGVANYDSADKPYPTLEAVPPGFWKDVIQRLGRLLFIDSFSVFPVSYLDEDLIVFDFELLGTRICAKRPESKPTLPIPSIIV